MTLPNFLCIGAQKAGTTWLNQQLESHPDIWLPPIKELHYFDSIFIPEVRGWVGKHIKTSIQVAIKRNIYKSDNINLEYLRYLLDIATKEVLSEEWYHMIFSGNLKKKVAGDITPSYCAIGPEGISHVRGILGTPKIIYLVRDPVSRALSQLRMNAMRQKFSGESEAEWLELAKHPIIRHRGAYSKYVPQWDAAFLPEDILYIPFKKVSEDPDNLLRDIEVFLGVSHHKYAKSKEKVHATKSANIPYAVIDFLNQEFNDEREFLSQRFGREFLGMC